MGFLILNMFRGLPHLILIKIINLHLKRINKYSIDRKDNLPHGLTV